MSFSQPAPTTKSPGWIYPPPLSQSFVSAYNDAFPKNDTTKQPTDLLLSAVQNLTAAIGGHATAFGREQGEVHVGDVIEPEWSGGENRALSLNCVVCSQGKDGAGVFEACAKYTETAHTSTFYDTTPPRSSKAPYTLPPLSQTFNLPAATVGVCFFFMPSVSDSENMYDFSIPFPVLQATRTPHHCFNSSNPTGTADPAIETTTTASPHASTTAIAKTANPSNLQTIVGVILGVLIGVLMFITVGWWCWWWLYERRKKSEKHDADREVRMGDSGNGESQEAESRGSGVEMQRVGQAPVVREVEKDETAEAPPAYHEIVRPKNDAAPAAPTAPTAFTVYR